jgi:hypothetical protein
VDPVRGSDTNPGTATQPFQTVRYALTTDVVSSAANTIGSGTDGGTDVTVTIVRAETEVVPGTINNINTPTLDRGSVTVVGLSGFNFNLNNRPLTLNKGYRLRGFQITSGDPSSSSSSAKAAITLAAAGTPLKDMFIDCTGLGTAGNAGVGSGDRCIEVTASSATVTLDNVDVLIKGDQNFTAGIRHVGTNTILRVINGSSVVATGQAPGSPGNQGVVGILESSNLGSVEIEGPNTEVNLSAIQPFASGARNVAILLKGNSGPERKVINSKIKVGEATTGQIGVCVGRSIDVTVQGNIFTNSPSGNNSIAICQQTGRVTPDPLSLSSGNTFNYFSTSSPDNRFVTSSCSCPS